MTENSLLLNDAHARSRIHATAFVPGYSGRPRDAYTVAARGHTLPCAEFGVARACADACEGLPGGLVKDRYAVEEVDRDAIERWVGRAADSLATFFNSDPSEGWFVRDSLLESGSGDKAGDVAIEGDPLPSIVGSTSNNRAYAAMCELLVYISENHNGRKSRWRSYEARARHQLQRMDTSYLSLPLRVVRAHSSNGQNTFSDAHVLLSYAYSTSRLNVVPDGAQAVDAAPRVRELVSEILARFLEHEGGQVEMLGVTSELVTMYGLRAIEAALRAVPEVRELVADNGELSDHDFLPNSSELARKLLSRARRDVLEQLGLHSARDPEFDPGSLIAAATVLQRLGYRASYRLIGRALEVIAESQDIDGVWRADMLTVGRKRLVYVSSLEMTFLAANLVLADLRHNSTRALELLDEPLARGFSLLEASFRDGIKANPKDSSRLFSGWANDRAKQLGTVESWSTALALQLLLRLEMVLVEVAQLRVLRKYNSRQRYAPYFPWPDLAPVLPSDRVLSNDADEVPSAQVVAWTPQLADALDPSPEGEIRAGVREDVVTPVWESTVNRPGAVRSFLLYGPPGTGKTSLISALAEDLRWPELTISPADFLREGIEGLERNADQIFRDLDRLRRVVVLFDECEELFRRRLSVRTPEHRTQGAFITTGMLPRLARLHKLQWVVFAIATNTELDELDPAVTRQGRLDRRQRIGHPPLKAQLAYVQRADLGTAILSCVEAALREYDELLDSHDYVDAPTRRKLLSERELHVKQRKKTGRLDVYFEEVNRLRAIESELPLVTFAVLRDLLRWDDLGKASAVEIRDELVALCRNERGFAWYTEPALEPED